MTTIDTRYGAMEVVDSDSIVSESLRVYGEWAQHEIDWIKFAIEPGSVVLDIGAFIGTHTLAFSRFVGNSGRVLSFEPQTNSFATLARNVESNELQNVEIFNVGVSDSCRSIVLNNQRGGNIRNYGGLKLLFDSNLSSTSVGIEILTIDTLNLPTLSVVKIDVEGMELEVLKGGVETIRGLKPTIFVECNDIQSGVKIKAFADELGYLVFGNLSEAFNSQNFKGASENIFEGACEVTLLLIPSHRKSDFGALIERSDVMEITSADELALLMLAKPQYPAEVLTGIGINTIFSSVAKSLSIGAKSIELLKLSHTKTESLANDRLLEIEQLDQNLRLSHLALEETKTLALERLQLIETQATDAEKISVKHHTYQASLLQEIESVENKFRIEIAASAELHTENIASLVNEQNEKNASLIKDQNKKIERLSDDYERQLSAKREIEARLLARIDEYANQVRLLQARKLWRLLRYVRLVEDIR